MPVTVESGVSGPFIPNGSATDFAFNFKADSASEVIVVDEDGTPLSPALYSVTLSGGEGGSVSFSVAPELSDYSAIYILSSPSMTQAADFGNAGPSFNPVAITRAFDKAAIRDLSLQAQIDRAIKVPFGDTGTAIPAGRAGLFLSFDGNGDPVVSAGTGADAGLRTDLAASNGASLLNFVNPSAGAFATTVADKLMRFVDVLDFIPVALHASIKDGTNNANLSVYIQAAIDSMTEGGTLYFPPGNYRLTDELVVPSVGGIVFAGAGGNDSRFGAPVPSGCGTFIFQVTDNKSIFKLGGGCSYMEWRDMTLSSTLTPGPNPVGTGRYGVEIESTLPFVLWRLSFNRVIFFNLSRGVSCVDTAAGTHIPNQDLSVAPVTFKDCFWTYCQTGVYLDTNNADLWKWDSCFFFVPSSGDGVILKSFGTLFFDVVTIGGTGVSNNRFLNIAPGALGSVEKITLKGIQTENLTHSIYIAPGGAYTLPLTIHISDSIFELGSDMYLGDACHLVTDNNRFSNNQIYIDSADVKLTTISDQFSSSDYSFLTGTADAAFVNTTWGPFPSALYGNRVYENGTKTIGSTAGVLNLTATTIITFPAEAALYEVFAYLIGGGATLMNAVRIACDGTALLVAGGDAGPAGMTITVSGFNVQVNQSSGGTQTVQWRWRRIA